MTVYAAATTDAYCCGLLSIGNFRQQGTDRLEDGIRFNDQYVYKIATFINTPVCKKAYEIMCRDLKLVSQTIPHRNPLSGNQVFVAVFTNKGK
jgi:hypothetical protein